MDLSFYKGRRVFVTGHTGFKGSWLCRLLLQLGAEVAGYALAPAEEPNLYALSGVEGNINSTIADIRNLPALNKAIQTFSPEVVIHMAAQPLVLEGYRCPASTFETNVMGTVHLLDAVRQSPTVRSVVNVTTDKVYKNREWPWGYRETDALGGQDPYACSKSCAELVTDSYRDAFLTQNGVAVSTLRCGNVIGGGDFAKDRILPDCVRAALEGRDIQLRNPGSVRPYQHVLEALCAYLLVGNLQMIDPSLAGCYNIGPEEDGCVTTGELVAQFCTAWGQGLTVRVQPQAQPHESTVLRLNTSLAKTKLGWKPRWTLATAMDKTVEWTRAWAADGSAGLASLMEVQGWAYLEE